MQRRLVITCWILLFPLLAYQQEGKQLWFHALNSLPNYSPSFNYWVYHDSEGFVWISSTAGLNRFDGGRVKHYNSDQTDSTSLFTGENIQSTFFEDIQKNLWFSTSDAIHCYIRKSDNFKHFQVRDKDCHTVQTGYRVFFLEKDSFLWFNADTAIYRLDIYQPDEYTFITKSDCSFNWADTLADGSVRAIYPKGNIKNNGSAFCAIEKGKVKGRKKWFSEKYPFVEPSSVVDLLPERDTLTWLGTDKGLVAWNPQSGNWRTVGEKNLGFCYIANWGNKQLIVWSLSNGLYSFDKESEVCSPMNMQRIDGQKISTQDVFDIYLDKADNLWVSSLASGLIYTNLNKTKFNSIPKSPTKDGNTSYGYYASLWDNSGNFWHGSNPNGLFLLNGKGELLQQFHQRTRVANSLPGEWVKSLLQDEQGRIWVGTQNGLAWMDKRNKGIFHSVLPENRQSLYIVGLCQLKRNSAILVSSIDQGIFIVKNKNGKPVLKRVTPVDAIYGLIYEDKSGRIFCNKDESAIEVFTLQKDTLHLVQTLPVRGLVTGFYEDKDGETLWVASMSGLIKLKLDTLKVERILTEKDGLIDKNIHAMLADNSENLWLSTPKGLVEYQRKDGRFREFSLADGMQSTEFQFMAGAKRPNGELWFGGANGITIVPPSQIDSLKIKPKVKITDIKINDLTPMGLKDADMGATNISEIRRLVLPYGDNTLSFEFVAIEYSAPSSNSLKYMLKGADDNWIELKKGEPGFARYPKLRHGNYTFWIQGANSDGTWGEPYKAMEITVRPHWTNTWWFKISATILAALLIWLVIHYRIAQIREKADLNTRVAENKMAALRAQMNPHFVFNSLQTVNGFIAKQDLRGALEYVNQFAKLMRVILENSREAVISLEGEIELLELYMKIEAKRLINPFTYSVNIGKEVDTYSMQIPSMLLQPFVENAIKHGLFHKKEGGHININFLRENGSLKCVVEDNGVGRAKSAEINAQQGRSHKSRGLQIVNERLAIIRKVNGGNYDVKISDLFDRQQNPSGTRAEITLPIS